MKKIISISMLSILLLGCANNNKIKEITYDGNKKIEINQIENINKRVISKNVTKYFIKIKNEEMNYVIDEKTYKKLKK